MTDKVSLVLPSGDPCPCDECTAARSAVDQEIAEAARLRRLLDEVEK